MDRNHGFFENDVRVEWLTHPGADRKMQLLETFSFTDPNDKIWIAESGHTIDGASIPSLFWSIIGPPFVGDYRRASVIHDVYCDTRSESWRATHRMFYHACRAGGVSWLKARIMYAAVYAKGPRWDVSAHEFTTFDGLTITEGTRLEVFTHITDNDVRDVITQIETEDLSLEEIETRLDENTRLSAAPLV